MQPVYIDFGTEFYFSELLEFSMGDVELRTTIKFCVELVKTSSGTLKM